MEVVIVTFRTGARSGPGRMIAYESMRLLPMMPGLVQQHACSMAGKIRNGPWVEEWAMQIRPVPGGKTPGFRIRL